jgi:hypothetical protein
MLPASAQNQQVNNYESECTDSYCSHRRRPPARTLFGGCTGRKTGSIIRTIRVFGRGFQPEEEIAGRNRVALLSCGLWRRQFGGDLSLLDKAIQLNGESYEVVGIMPADFQFPGTRELWVPLTLEPAKEPWRNDLLGQAAQARDQHQDGSGLRPGRSSRCFYYAAT